MRERERERQTERRREIESEGDSEGEERVIGNWARGVTTASANRKSNRDAWEKWKRGWGENKVEKIEVLHKKD